LSQGAKIFGAKIFVHCGARVLTYGGPTWIHAVLQSLSPTVTLCLTRAANAREQAWRTTLKSERAFCDRMEQRWLSIAASTAFAERVDLFVHTLQSTSLPHDACAQCRGVMSVEVIEATARQDIYTLRCRECGDTERKMVVRYTPSGSAGRDTACEPPALAPCPPRSEAPEAPPLAGQNPDGA
jgi:hypothetical protein